MKVAFFVSSIGDTDLALNTIKSMEQKGQYETLLIALTAAAEQRISDFQSSSLILKKTLSEILSIENFPAELCTENQLHIVQYIKKENINCAYFGVPSVNNEIPFQIAQSLEHIPVLIAYEFMFKPETHCLWKYVVDGFKNKPNIKYCVPLPKATKDFEEHGAEVYITGHLSIDNACSSNSAQDLQEIRDKLQVSKSQTLAFVSSTTQPSTTDATFLESLLAELPNHPDVQVRFGLHPGIQDLDSYIGAILAVYEKHSGAHEQFKIILPDNLLERFKTPELSINNALLQHVFLRVNISGADASLAADIVAQAVPGSLLNQGVFQGKSCYCGDSAESYLPEKYFSNSSATFFCGQRQAPPVRNDLGLNDKPASENYADIISLAR